MHCMGRLLALRVLSCSVLVLAAQLSRLQQAEEEAVQREDFEQAAILGEELDTAAARLAELQQRIKVWLLVGGRFGRLQLGIAPALGCGSSPGWGG